MNAMEVTIPGHLFGEMPFLDIVDDAETIIVDLHNRPDLANIRGALQGGLLATLIDVAVDVFDVSQDRLAARSTLSFAVLVPRRTDQPTAP